MLLAIFISCSSNVEADVVIEQTYEGENRDLLLTRDVEQWLDHARASGFDLSSETLQIVIDGEAKRQRYGSYGVGPGTFHYSGATVNIRINLTDAEGRLLHDVAKAGHVNPPRQIQKSYIGPSSAPFEKALERAFNPGMASFLITRFGPEALVTALQDPSWRIRIDAANALAGAQDQRAFDVLVATLEDQNHWRDRANAATSLGKLGDPRAIELLFNVFLNDTSGGAQRRAGESLERIDPEWYEDLTEDQISELIIGAFINNNLFVRERCLKLIKEIDPNWPDSAVRVVEPLIAALEDGGLMDRRYAAEALGYIGDARAVDPLIVALKDEYDMVRRRAAEALGGIGDASAVEALIAALKDEGPGAGGRQPLVQALRQITKQSYGRDPKKWQQWWDENKEEMLKER